MINREKRSKILNGVKSFEKHKEEFNEFSRDKSRAKGSTSCIQVTDMSITMHMSNIIHSDESELTSHREISRFNRVIQVCLI